MMENINNQNAKIDLTTQWVAQRCPIVDGIIFRDGRIRQMLVKWVRGQKGRLELSVGPGDWTTLAEFAATKRLEWTGVIPLSEAKDVARDLRAVCGEGGLGSDGFVALTRASDGQVLWIAFFNESNPFEVVELSGDQVVAKTNLGTCWRFPLESPHEVTLG